MKDLAPEITRQRLLIEGYYTINVNKEIVESYLLGLSSHLDLRTYEKPIVHASDGIGKEQNEGYDAFVPLIDSGISLYIWTSARFFSIILFSCKKFDIDKAVRYTREYFSAIKWVYELF